MRKVTASLFSTLDGVVEAPNAWQFAFDDAALTRLELVESQPTSSGVLIATYRPAR